MRVQKIDFQARARAALVVCLASASAAAAAEGSFQRTLQVNGPVNLEISTGSGSIQVRAGSRNEVSVTGHIKATASWFGTSDAEKVKRLEANPPIQQSGNDIRIGHIDDPELRRNLAISYDVAVPAETELRSHSGSGNQMVEDIRGPLDIDTGSGGIHTAEIGDRVRAATGSGSIVLERVKGNVRAKTGSGTIRALGIAGGFEGDTGSGDITLEQTASGAVRADTGSGGMDLRGIHGSLDAKAGSGTIQAEGTPTGAWVLHSGSGSVRLRLASDAAFDLSAHTSSGSISVNHPVTVQGSMRRKDIRGKVRGGGVPVQVETGSGNIDID
jgi:Putative adhesin